MRPAARRPRSSRWSTARSSSGTRPTCRQQLARTWFPRSGTRCRVFSASSRYCLLQLGLELVADAEAGLDERMLRRVAVDLLTQAPHEDVDGAVAVRLAPAPDLLQQL